MSKIAVAPELLEALELAHDYLSASGWEGDNRLVPISLAITKAKAAVGRPTEQERTAGNLDERIKADQVMVAAPDMLNALNAFPSRLDETDAAYLKRVFDWWYRVGYKAIAKAEGRS